MAYAAVAFLSDNLNELVTNHRDLMIHGTEQEEILQLQNELSQLKHVLEGASTKEKTDRANHKAVRLAMYHVEDAIDTVISKRRLSSRKSGRRMSIPKLVSSSSTSTSTSTGRLEIKQFTEERLRPLINKLQREFAVFPTGAVGHESDIADANHLQPRRLTPPWAKTQEYYVGQEKDLGNLINHITDEESNYLQVVFLFGKSGLGKTTMARRIFHDPRIQEEFPFRIWLTVYWELDMKSFCLTILKSYTSRDMSSKTCEELLVIVPEYLRMGKFFMVVDDLRSVGAWYQIERILPMLNKNCRVFATATDMSVAPSYLHNHEMQHLTDEESWNLLRSEVFGHHNGYPKDLEPVGKLIAELCTGVPVLILIVAGTLKKLVQKSTLPLKKQWEDVHQSLETELSVDYPTYFEGFLIIMSWSYHTLPEYLKDCLVYTGMLPAEIEIPVWKLTQLWIAEGLVRQKQGQTLEETAKDYVMELIHANFLIVDKISLHGDIKTCHFHGLVHELCLDEGYREDLFEVIKDRAHPPRSRRLCIDSGVHTFLYNRYELEKARTFLCYSKSPIILEDEEVSKFTDVFDLVRVLEAHCIKFPMFPTKLAQLVHLRYITLSCDDLKILPEDISNLWNLQTLVVDTKSPTLEVKADIWKLMHLRFMKTKASLSLAKSKGNGCENLHTLTRLSPQSFTSDVPDKAKKLKVLGIRGMLSDSLGFEKLDSLEKLKLQHDVYPRKQSEYPLAALPQPEMFPPNLKFLVLSGTYLDWKRTSILGILPNLEALKLKDNAFKGATWEVADGGFKSLEALSINEAELKYWTASSSSFPELRNLELNNCEKLLEVPLELGKTLEKLSMSCVTRYAVSCAEKIKQARAEDGAEFKLEIQHGDM